MAHFDRTINFEFTINGKEPANFMKDWAELFRTPAPSPTDYVAYVWVDASKGNARYRVTKVNGKAVACTCKAFEFHGGTCKHMAMVK